MNTDRLRTQLMRFMQSHRGKDRAIPRDGILFHLKLWEPSLDDRGLRKVYAALPLCSCKDGLFLPSSAEEVEEFRDYLSRGAGGPIAAQRRCQIIWAYYPHLAPVRGEQRNLSFGEAGG
jgi:hypothetical protein